MRTITGLLLIALMGGGASNAFAASDEDAARAALNREAFAKPRPTTTKPALHLIEARVSQGEGAVPLAAPAAAAPLASDQLFSSRAWAVNGGVTAWRSQSVANVEPNGAVDTLRMTVGGVSRGPGGLVLAGPGGRFEPETQNINLAYERALRLSGGRYDVDVAPLAGLAMSDTGGSALAGAAVRLQLPQRKADAIDRLGFVPDVRSSASNRGRWFLFAQSSGELVGVHLSRDGRNLIPRAALTLDDGVQPTVVSDSQAGIGWRKGDLQASFGYVHREIKNDASFTANHQVADIKGDMVALTFSLKSH